MKTSSSLVLLTLAASLVLAGCGQPQPAVLATSLPTEAFRPTATLVPPSPTPPPVATPLPLTPTDTPIPPPPSPTPVTAQGWSSSASTRTELSFHFSRSWDGSSPLTSGEVEFVKHPDRPLGVIFQIGLRGDPAALLANWGSRDVGIVGYEVSFVPDRDRPLEVTSYAPSDEWEAANEVAFRHLLGILIDLRQ